MSVIGLRIRPAVRRAGAARQDDSLQEDTLQDEADQHRGSRRRIRTVTLGLAILVSFAACWALLAPPQLGGGTSYVVTSGTSMLPRYHAQDLVILRRQASYHVGEVAAYHNGQLHVVVLHRIVARDGSRYVFKGDNNNFRDTFEPTASQIVGAQVVHVTGAGKLVDQVRRPAVAAVLLGLLWILSFGPAKDSTRRRKGSETDAPPAVAGDESEGL